MVEVYTDGSCINLGPGGWAFIMIIGDIEYHVSSNNPKTTNNRMELQAVIEALSFVPDESSPPLSLKIYTDSKLVLHCAKGDWKRKANLDLWERYDIVSKGKIIEWVWVKGHDGNRYNELVDKLAREQAMSVY